MSIQLPLLLRIYMFLVGFGWAIEVGIVGRFALTEVLLYLALPFLLMTNRVRIWNNTAKIYFLLVLVFCVAVIVSDIISSNHFELFLRGFARPIAIGLNTLSLVLLVARSPRLLLYFAYGMFPGAVTGYFQESQFHDFGYQDGYVYFSAKVEPILRAFAIVSGIALYRFHRLLSALVMFIPGIIVAFYGSRSGAAFYFLSGGAIALLWMMKGRGRGLVDMNFRFIFLTGAAMVMVVSIAYISYIFAAPKGLLGERQQAKFFDQSSTKFGVSPVGLVLSGRTAVVGSLLASVDNPIFGLGSWPNIGEYLLDAIHVSGGSVSDSVVTASFLQRGAGHSIILGTWSNNGIFALAFWVYFCYIMVKVFLYFMRRDNLLTPMVVFLFFELSWHLMFSPLGPKSRIYVAIFAALAICVVDRRGPLVRAFEFALLSPFSKAYEKNSFFRMK